jgi:predicted GNAT family acetyltransferase
MAQDESADIRLSKNDARHRYELTMDGTLVSLADYYERNGVVVIPHTETLPQFGGRGLAARVVAFALADIAAQDKKVDPQCPYVGVFIERNPEWRDLLSRP